MANLYTFGKKACVKIKYIIMNNQFNVENMTSDVEPSDSWED